MNGEKLRNFSEGGIKGNGNDDKKNVMELKKIKGNYEEIRNTPEGGMKG